ncbi:MAG TPA: sugar phosphate isomerase/epimerase [Acidobacteriaceae bacterium]|jgi:sugar phosphate isomerase/epimerase
MIKFACADFTFPLMERQAALRLIGLLGFSHVDVGLFARSDHFSPLALQESPSSYTAQVIRDLHAADLRASDVFLQIGVDPAECSANDPDARRRQLNRDTFLRSIEFCVALGCGHLTGLPGVLHSQASRERDVDVAAEEALWRVAACAGAGLHYAIEPHVGSLCPDVATTTAFLKRVPGLTLTLDYGHFVMAGEPSDRIHPLLPSASHIHVRGGAPGRLQTSVKENTIDFAGMAAGLQSLDYRGFLALEYVWIDWNGCNGTDNVSETLLLRRALESALHYEVK